MSEKQWLAGELEDVVQGLGFEIVEANQSVVKGRTHVHLVVYREEGVNVDHCAEIHKTLAPRLELILDDRDVALQVSSPGIDRVFKHMHEFSVFAGRGVRVLRKSNLEWEAGRIESSDEQSVTLQTGESRITVEFADIQKAKLDYTQEVK
ncbi:MAG: ribosome assembly cofactor RimP [Spirochaetales bacterium]